MSVEVRAEVEEALRCLTLIGHVPRSSNTWASRCIAAEPHLQAALTYLRLDEEEQAKPPTEEPLP